MKRWMNEHHGQTVLTFQTDKRNMSAWNPGPRKVDASRSTYVLLDESRRDYKGMRVVSSGPDDLMVEDDWHLIHYTVVK